MNKFTYEALAEKIISRIQAALNSDGDEDDFIDDIRDLKDELKRDLKIRLSQIESAKEGSREWCSG